MKELKIKDTELRTYKPKQERSFKIVFKYMYSSSNVDDIRKKIENHGHTVIKIWNIWNKKQGSSKTLPVFYRAKIQK